MSIVVIYEGQRKAIKVSSPNTLVQLIVAEAAEHFKVDISKAALKHRKSILDPSQPFRFCGLSNNAQVDLVVSKTASSGKPKQCRIALAIEGAENVTETFDSDLTLLGVLSELVNRGKLPGDIQFRSPELVYLRAKYEGLDALSSTTLSSLGLAGQSARLQLRFGAAVSLIQNQSSVPAANINTSSTPSSESVHEPASATNLPPVATATAATAAVSQVTAAEPSSADTAMQVDEPSPPPQSQPQPSLSISVPPTNTVPPTPPTAPTAQPSSPAQQEVPSPTACLQLLLTENFDAVSGPAVLTLSKYLFNVLLYPEDERFWRINTENKTFAGKVLPAKGAVQFLHSVGFLPKDTAVLALRLRPSPVAVGRDGLPPAEQTRLFVQDLLAANEARFARLGEGWSALQGALQELAVKAEDWPAGGPLPLIALVRQREERLSVQAQVQRQQLAAFDPFKPHIVRAAPQPVRKQEEVTLSTEGGGSGKAAAVMKLSATEAQLLELQRKREALLGRPEEVERLTEVVFPKSEGSSSGASSAESAMDVTGEGDDKSVPKAVLQKILKRSSQEDDAPLTTQAVRDLQRAQKERVYARTLIRIKFPDRVCLQGYFHPHHTAVDVYTWVTACLALSATPFELYTSPPRTVLPLSSSDSGGGGQAPTLADLKLVPAAMVHLSWKAPPAGSADSVGGYLCSELLASSSAGGKESNSSAEQPSSAYPTGRALVPTAAAAQGDAVLASAQGKSSSAGANDESGKKSFKPKWLKF